MVHTTPKINGYQQWYEESDSAWGTIQLGKDEKLEAISHPESFILTCEYCGTTTRVKDDFSCPACGALFTSVGDHHIQGIVVGLSPIMIRVL